ncbi:putative DUF1707 family protein [Corynebacterium uterequi]|uniref:Putative DUF1707 family protein n=2 Tax=Corynebacterium uterequi TaxID=1072256 RepID=A0A0G3HCJ4_9CORY|nr:putative DUF1707 family protein [Corynebacterium uterequi]
MGERRIGTNERSTAIERLGTYFADGYLTAEEFDERSSRAAVAVWDADLDALFADLPAEPATSTAIAVADPTSARAAKELDSLLVKGKILKAVDCLASVCGFTLLMLGLFVYDWTWFWVPFVAASAVPIGARLLLGVGKSEEKVYNDVIERERKVRAARLEHAAQRRRELGA